MSAHYDLIPLEPIEPEWLARIGLVTPENAENSRNPTAAEVRSAVKQLAEEGYLSSGVIFHIDGNYLTAWLNTNGQRNTLLSLEDYAEDNNEDTPRYLSSTYGSYEMAMVVSERLAHVCGPFLLVSQGGSLVIVEAGTPLSAEWSEGCL